MDFEVFLARDAERHLDMIVPGLGHEADGGGVRLHDRLKARIVGGGAARALGHAERHELGLELRRALEKRGVDRVRAGIAALDIVDAQRVEPLRDDALVLQRKIDAQRLRPVAERRVV